MSSGQRQQEQPAGGVVGDHRGVVDIQQFQAVEQQPGKRDSRPVRSLGQRPGMRSQRKVDRDAAVVVLKRGDDVAPEVVIRERAREEDECGPPAGRVPGQGTEPGFKSSGFHGYKTYSRYVI